MIKKVPIEFFGGPVDGADAVCVSGIKRLVIPVGGNTAVYEWGDRSTAVGWVFTFVGWLPERGDSGGK